MKDAYKQSGRHRYDRMYHFEIRKTDQGTVYEFYDPETGEHYIPYRKKSKKTGRPYRLTGRKASYITTEFYKGNITLVRITDPDALEDEPF